MDATRVATRKTRRMQDGDRDELMPDRVSLSFLLLHEFIQKEAGSSRPANHSLVLAR